MNRFPPINSGFACFYAERVEFNMHDPMAVIALPSVDDPGH